MSAEIGHLALLFSLFLALTGVIFPTFGLNRNKPGLIALARPLALAQFAFIAIAFFALMYSFLVSDFSVVVVALNSHTAKPLMYKIAGVWGNHEGSLLLWVLILSLFGALVALFGKHIPFRFQARALSIQAMIASGFLLFMVFTSNPFFRLVENIPPQGNGLNPLLQDPGLAFHPPVLYLGYVGFSIAFSFAMAALIEKAVTPAWARWARPWVLTAWMFLTIGVALGSWWAYYELGWGGFWFWDPVENASFMPWLAGAALLHSLRVVEKRDALKSWTVLLAILTFSLSLIGTFLVRSGVLTSVHAFATDPTRGIFILVLLVLAIGGALTLFAIRAPMLRREGQFEPVSREGALILNNLFLVTAVATVFIGTLYPLFVDALTGAKLSVGAPFYERTFVPLMVPLILLLAVGPLLSWKKASASAALSRVKWGALFIFLGALGAGLAFARDQLLAVAGLALGVWLIFGVLRELAFRIKLGAISASRSLRRLVGLPRAHIGMALAHLGLGVFVLGVTGAETWTREYQAVMQVGERVEVAGYEFDLKSVRGVAGANYTALRGEFDVSRNREKIVTLFPEQRTYTSPQMVTTEAAIRTLFLGDLYVVIGETDSGQGWSVRLYFKPLVAWIWMGALLMALGGLVALTDRGARLSVNRPVKTSTAKKAKA